MDPLSIGIVVGSVRPHPQRKALPVAQWALAHAEARGDAAYELLDLADFALPVLDEPLPAAHGHYEHAHTRAWSERIAALDAFVIVTPEYNHSLPGPLKNAIDFLYSEWFDKAAGYISYGIDAGGARAVEHLRVVMNELRVASVREHVALSLSADFTGDAFTPQPYQEARLGRLLEQLIAWGGALRTLRQPAATA